MHRENHSPSSAAPQRVQAEEALKQFERVELRPRTATSARSSTFFSSREDGSPTLRILETSAEFEKHRDHWSAWSEHPEADLDFFSIRLRYRPGVVRPYVMVVYRSGRPDCMLVGWIYEGPQAFKVGSVVLLRAETRILRFVNGGFLGDQSLENARFLVGQILKTLSRKEIHAVDFSQMSVNSPLYDLAKSEPSLFCREKFTSVQTHRYLTLPANFDQYLRSRGANSRSHFRRCKKMLATDFPGRVRFQSVRNESDVEDFARTADAISRKTYQRALGAGFVNDLETRALLRTAAQRGALRASVLWVEEQAVAFVSGIICSQTLHATYTGYDRAFRRYCPGMQTILHFIEELFEPGGSILRLDSGCGDTFYKRKLFDSSWEEGPVWIFAPSAKGLMLHALRAVSTSLHYAAMGLFEKSHHLRKLKKLWHGRLVEVYQRESY